MSEPTDITDHAGQEVRPDFGPPSEGPSRPEVAHENTDANVRMIFAVGAGLGVTVAVVYLLLWGLFDSLAVHSGQDNPVTFPLAAEANARPLPERVEGVPAPRLEAISWEESPEMRPVRQPTLEGYGWVEKGRVARIPIDAAMREVLRGKEFQAPRPVEKGVTDRRQGLETPAQPNSGRGAPWE